MKKNRWLKKLSIWLRLEIEHTRKRNELIFDILDEDVIGIAEVFCLKNDFNGKHKKVLDLKRRMIDCLENPRPHHSKE